MVDGRGKLLPTPVCINNALTTSQVATLHKISFFYPRIARNIIVAAAAAAGMAHEAVTQTKHKS
jgi:hypothetical protein